jgi:hypothetical protein
VVFVTAYQRAVATLICQTLYFMVLHRLEMFNSISRRIHFRLRWCVYMCVCVCVCVRERERERQRQRQRVRDRERNIGRQREREKRRGGSSWIRSPSHTHVWTDYSLQHSRCDTAVQCFNNFCYFALLTVPIILRTPSQPLQNYLKHNSR